jgi:hypothetical protein
MRLRAGAGRVHRSWEESEMIDALGAWADQHGRSPEFTDWFFNDADRPTSHTVRRRFGSWPQALKYAGLESAGRKCGWERDGVPRTERVDRRPPATRPRGGVAESER